jgi:hypothetical protein
MGFGKKTDYPTGRVLDLDKSYRYIIQPAVKAAGLECKRADEIIHSGIIDVPMYEQLLMADVVVADLSTYNCNAFYELGVRHALKPYTTITIAEDKMVYPFDLGHIAIRKYQHMGDGIDFGEVERMRGELRQAIEIIANKPTNDSPVYEFLKDLKPPMLAIAEAIAAVAPPPPVTASADNPTVSVLMTQVDDAFKRSDFTTAKALLNLVRTMLPSEAYVVQKLALATYKSKSPDPISALQEAKQILLSLKPDVSTDPETLGLWGAVHKQLWDRTKAREALDTALFSYEKGFNLKNDHYNGINLAYLLNVRAAVSDKIEDAIADFVLARRTRQRIIPICEGLLNGRLSADEKYWLLATLAEAAAGVGDMAGSKKYLDEAAAIRPAPAQWMNDSTSDQLARLTLLLTNSPLDRIK